MISASTLRAAPGVTVPKNMGYPLYALAHGIQGKVMLWLRTDEKGVPLDVKVVKSSGHKILDDYARASAFYATFPHLPQGLQGNLQFDYELGKNHVDPYSIPPAKYFAPRIPLYQLHRVEGPVDVEMALVLSKGGFVSDVEVTKSSGQLGLDSAFVYQFYLLRFDLSNGKFQPGEVIPMKYHLQVGDR